MTPSPSFTPFARPVSGDCALLEEWRTLHRDTNASPFLSPDWITAWHQAFAPEQILELHGVRDAQGTIAAALPVVRRLDLRAPIAPSRSRSSLRSPTNWHTPEFGWSVRDREALPALLDASLDETGRRLSISFLSPDDAELLADAARRHGLRVLTRAVQHSPVLPLTDGFATVEASLPRKVRSEMRRRTRKLEERGTVTFETIESTTRGDGPITPHEEETVRAALAEGFAVEASGWKGERGTAIAAEAHVRSFYETISLRAFEAGLLRLHFLRLDGRALAFDLSFETSTHHSLVKTGFDPEFRSFGAGKILRRAMIEAAAERGITSYEFLGADAPWKSEWTSQRRDRVLVQAFRNGPAGLLDYSVHRHGRPLARRLRDWARSWRGNAMPAPAASSSNTAPKERSCASS